MTVAVGPFSLFSEWLLCPGGYAAAARAADARVCLSGGDLFDPISIRYDLDFIGCLENSSALRADGDTSFVSVLSPLSRESIPTKA